MIFDKYVSNGRSKTVRILTELVLFPKAPIGIGVSLLRAKCIILHDAENTTLCRRVQANLLCTTTGDFRLFGLPFLTPFRGKQYLQYHHRLRPKSLIVAVVRLWIIFAGFSIPKGSAVDTNRLPYEIHLFFERVYSFLRSVLYTAFVVYDFRRRFSIGWIPEVIVSDAFMAVLFRAMQSAYNGPSRSACPGGSPRRRRNWQISASRGDRLCRLYGSYATGV